MLARDKQKLVEKLTGQKYRDWERKVCNQEGMALIQGKGDFLNEVLNRRLQDAMAKYVKDNLCVVKTDKPVTFTKTTQKDQSKSKEIKFDQEGGDIH